MLITSIQNYNKISHIQNNTTTQSKPLYNQTQQKVHRAQNNVTFTGFNPFKPLNNYIQYKRAQDFSDKLYKYVDENIGEDNFVLRNINLDPLEGIQYNIKAFKGMTMKEIQYLSENLHVITVKRGCKHMCGHCYAEAKPSNREMSYEDFHTITSGFKTLRKRLHNLDIFGKNQGLGLSQPIYRTTELFFDADCMDLVIKDAKGKEHDFIDLSEELYDSLGRTTVFDTSGWYKNNTKMQQRAEKYAEHFSNPKNMEKLENFNVSFNVFNASYMASIKALQGGDIKKAKLLKNRFLDDIVNTLFTFTPVSDNEKFGVIFRAFHPSVKNTKHFNAKDLAALSYEIRNKLLVRYQEDLVGEQKVIKNKDDIKKYIKIMENNLSRIDTSLNPSGRMQEFLREHNINPKALQDVDEIREKMIEFYSRNPRQAPPIMYKLIDADGRVYNMNYATMFKTELQLNLDGKNVPTPELAGVLDNFIITRKNINKKG